MAINPNDISVDYITPDSHVWLLKGVPLEPNYENTILWEATHDYVEGIERPGETTEQARERQFQWFTYDQSKFNRIDVPATTYLREGRKYIRIDKPMKDLIGYNYMVFKNEGDYTYSGTTMQRYENKYWYAFITKLEYLNDRVTIVHYSIDVMQTFMFDCTPTQCFVEREHSATDQVGDNTLNEDIPIGDVLYIDRGDAYALRYWVVCMFVSEYYTISSDQQLTWYAVDGHRVGGKYDSLNDIIGSIYSGLRILTFSVSDAGITSLNNTIKHYTDANKEASIASICMFPRMLTGSTPFENVGLPTFNWQVTRDIAWSYMYQGKIGPRNNKLYCYPYNKLYISDNNGNAYDFRYELFNKYNNTVDFEISASPMGNGEIMAIPIDYRTNTSNSTPNYNERMCIKGLPQCAYVIDTYRAWVAQNRNQLVTNQQQYVIGSLLGPLMSLSFTDTVNQGQKSLLSGVGNAANVGANTANILAKNYDMQTAADTVKSQDTPSLNQQQGLLNFRAYNVHVKDEYACMIDDYFDLYGYACRRLKVPNRNVRENWCYCKTVGCRLYGTITGDVDEKICSIYNNGIRFWKNGNNIGSYNTVRNRCVSEIPT